jgi:hypothetical protein
VAAAAALDLMNGAMFLRSGSMMLAYKFRPNPLNNPRRKYY